MIYNATDQELWITNYLATITPQVGATTTSSLTNLVSSSNNYGVFKYEVIDYIETNDIYGNYEGFFQGLMEGFGLNNKYKERYLLSTSNTEYKDYYN